MSQVELQKGITKATIDTQGAWLTELHDERGLVFTPKGLFTSADGAQKERGGCHVCLPNFDSGGDSGLPHHGFGRVMDWLVTEQTSDAVTLRLEQGSNGYEALHSELVYQLADLGLRMELTLRNHGSSSLAVSPGFHPYYATRADETQLQIDGVDYSLSDYKDAAVLTNQPATLSVGERRFSLNGSNLPAWVLWSDRLGDYVCLEPTAGGMNFAAGNADRLEPGQKLSAIFEVTWTV